MKIGLIGAPGAGKSALAESLATELGLKAIDGYVERLEEDSGYVFGRYGTYAGNIGIGLHRHFAEHLAESFVTCGTMIETISYMALIPHYDPEDLADTRRLTGGLVVLGCMVEDMFDYDHVFYVPSLPTDAYSMDLIQAIEEAMVIFDIKHTILENPDTHLDDALAAIHATTPSE